MRKDRPRKTRETWQQKIWDFLSANGPQPERAIRALRPESRRHNTTDALRKLIAKGCVRHIGQPTWGKYEAIGERPSDERGMAATSQVALNRLNQEAKRQKETKVPLVEVHHSAFAQSLAWICNASRVDTDERSCVNTVEPAVNA